MPESITVHPPAARQWLESGPRMTQADADASLRRVHGASAARAAACGYLVRVEVARHLDRRSLEVRLLLADAERLHADLGAAIAQARRVQEDLDVSESEQRAAAEVSG